MSIESCTSNDATTELRGVSRGSAATDGHNDNDAVASANTAAALR
jgi:hypothetical protein